MPGYIPYLSLREARVRETEQQLNEFPQEILCFDFNIFDKLVDKVIIISKEQLVFELRCGIKLREAIQWN